MMPTLACRALLLVAFAACDEDRGDTYAAELAEEATRLTLHASDVEHGVLSVALTGFFDANDGCPVFDATATVNGQALMLVAPGGVVDSLSADDHKECAS